MVMFIILLAIIASAVGFYWHQRQSVASNRYRKNTKKITPQLKISEAHDADTVLGIKKPSFEDVKKETTESVTVSAEKNNPQISAEPVVLYLMSAQDTAFGGYELLQVLLSVGLRFGAHQIFHRHEHKDGRGQVLFHCASAEKPGTFDPSRMGAFSTRGLCFFFTPCKDHDPLSTFDLMLDTIDQLIEELGGSVYDSHHQLFTKEKMIKYRQQIRCVESNKTTADLFAEID